MAVNRMKKLQIVAHSSYRPELIRFLQHLEAIHIVDLAEEKSSETAPVELESESDSMNPKPGLQMKPIIESAIRGVRNDLAELQFAINYLTKFEAKKGFIAGFWGSQVILSQQEYTEIIEDMDSQLKIPMESGKWLNICHECRSLEAEDLQLTVQQNKLNADKSYLLPWSNLDAPLEEIHDTEKTAIKLGVIPIIGYDNLCAEIESRGIDVFFETISETKREKCLLVIFLKEDADIIMPILTNHGFSPTMLPATHPQPLLPTPGPSEEGRGEVSKIAELLARIDENIQKIETRKSEVHRRSVELAKEKTKLMALYDHKLELLEQEEARENFIHTEHTVVIEGWARADKAETLKDKLLQNFEAIHVELSAPNEADEPPVDMENKRLFSPFQMVTNLYGIPRYREIDPTPYIAPFFAFFFGICLTDAGYGIVLALIAYLIGKKFVRNEGGGKQLFRVLILSGIATVIVGALTGGWFAIPIDEGPLSFLSKVRVINPGEDQMKFFAVVLGVGFLQVWFGFVVKMLIDIKERAWGSFFHSDLSWLIIMTGLPVLILFYKKLPNQLLIVIEALFVICAIWFVIFSDREGKNIAGRIGTGFFGLYSRISGSFGDILSYSRLFALGLATGIIANVVNTMALMTWNVPYLGKVMTVGILIGGHIFNIVINTLGGFIHTARLQFVEFFTKFYEGGGEPFKPFKREHVYTTIMENVKRET
ncbi:V-type ATP synthase subunit I [Candidatus Poribacteria bacterium]|nr:V-type ATP synthase subunit I [Candidatus Poribacteria bacterium]